MHANRARPSPWLLSIKLTLPIYRDAIVNSSLVSELEKAAIACVLLRRMFRFKKRQPNAILGTKAYCACQICIWSSVMGGPGYVCPKKLHQVNFYFFFIFFQASSCHSLILVGFN